MDSLTQVVLGAAVGEAVLGKKVGNRAMLWGAIAGTIPDLDVFTRFFTDPITATAMHRGFSHSIVFAILLSPILALIAQRIHRKRSATRSGWTWLFFWSLVTHPLLDAHTVWGTQLFWPFDYRLAYKNIFVIDPLYTLPFLLCLIIAACYKRSNPKRRLFNNAGLIISTTYMVLTLIFKGVGYTKFENKLTAQEIEYVDLDTRPTPLNALLWNAQVETDKGFLIGYYSLFDESEVFFSHEYPKNHALLDPIKDQQAIQQLIKISAGWYMVEDLGDRLIFTDIRFGQLGVDPDTSPFLWQYEIFVNEDGTVSCNRRENEFQTENMGEMLDGLIDRIKGN